MGMKPLYPLDTSPQIDYIDYKANTKSLESIPFAFN